MSEPFPRTKTLDQLDPPAWGPPTFSSRLVTRCHALRQVPIEAFTAGDLRIMIGQNIGLPWLMPIALEHLEDTPLVEGTFYPGDLLVCVLSAEAQFWANAPSFRGRIDTVIDTVIGTLSEIEPEVREAIEAFRGGG